MRRLGTVKSPVSPVIAERVSFVPVFVIVTFAPGTAAPEASVTVPEIVPRSDCAKATAAAIKRSGSRRLADLAKLDVIADLSVRNSGGVGADRRRVWFENPSRDRRCLMLALSRLIPSPKALHPFRWVDSISNG